MNIDKLSEEFVNNLVETNRGFNFYVDWNNTLDYKRFEIELNAMNVLIRCDDMHSKFVELVKKVPTVIATFPLLFALSKDERKNVWRGKNELKVVNEDLDEEDFYSYNFDINLLKKLLIFSFIILYNISFIKNFLDICIYIFKISIYRIYIFFP